METKVFAAKLENLHEMLDFIKAYCTSQHFAPPLIEQVILASEEALVNVISYSYQQGDVGYIDLSCDEADKAGIKMIIKDRGIAFNPLDNIPTELPAPSHLLNLSESSLGGYGIYLLTKIMDIVEYQRINDQNVLTLVKYS